ncbi:MAG: N-6 DNA methylase [Candidatus Promineifilaceae bacterium]|nr:N-6 DNA methylase [Candidatus Promineifilaceae bacterium]
MTDKQRTYGQFDTPPDVADLLLAFCLRHHSDTLLDPSCGNGALLERAARWQAWLAGTPAAAEERLWGIELDPAAAADAQASLPGAHVRHQNFFTVEPSHPFDAVVGNPPYTRAEWIGRLQEEAGEQLAIFGEPEEKAAAEKEAAIPARFWDDSLSRRAGLHAYFFLHGTSFLRPGGRLGFVVPNNWLDVAYGKGLKQFILQHYKVLALIEPTTERWFNQAKVNVCLVVLERCAEETDRNANLVRFVQLRRPLRELIGRPPDHADRFSRVEALAARLLPGRDQTTETIQARVVPQQELDAGEKWGLLWRAPAVYRRARRRAGQKGLAPLKQWATVRRGFTTGANDFFYLDEETTAQWAIEADFRRPLLKSLRGVSALRLAQADCDHEVLAIPPTASLAGTAAADYVAWGEEQGFHQRRTCAARRPWYVLPWQEPASIVLPKGIWGRHFAPVLDDPILVDQQLYQVHLKPGVSRPAAAALLNSGWSALQMELTGRSNFGEGVLWLAAYEVEKLLLPDPRYLTATEAEALATHFEALAQEPVPSNPAEACLRPVQRALDTLVFQLLGFTETEASVVIDSLLQRVRDRHARARR